MEAPDYIGNAISIYRMQKEDLVSGIPNNLDAYDKMEGAMITLNERETTKDHLLGLLNTLLSHQMSKEEKVEHLHNRFGMEVTDEIERRINVMCNYSDLIEEKGREEEEILMLKIFARVSAGESVEYISSSLNVPKEKVLKVTKAMQ